MCSFTTPVPLVLTVNADGSVRQQRVSVGRFVAGLT